MASGDGGGLREQDSDQLDCPVWAVNRALRVWTSDSEDMEVARAEVAPSSVGRAELQKQAAGGTEAQSRGGW